ncbi:hypothetical protein HU675_0017495 [Bradyrhizobium septentrionale]|uniref:hypothetical protein n=1 Tax=Bradyrhizobium septentrionale TaxID=1404411 RepID=UPI0015966645|nr:hypothetical protein [Bradyrhizobium septentrionale]UGY28406.1 hypothetical protein HU675_0017495 [Bradyrhizobium septentrionale]
MRPPDLLGVSARAIVLAGHLLDSLFGIAKVAANVCSPDTNKNANKSDGYGEFLRVFSTRYENFP